MKLRANCAKTAERGAWLTRLPDIVRTVQLRWSLTLESPFEGEDVSCAYVVPALRTDGTRAVLKIGMPHMEGEHELDGLRFWNGDPTVRLLEADEERGAMLLERCEPGTSLRELPEPEQDVVIAGLLHRLWRPPALAPAITGGAFRPLSAMIESWSQETLVDMGRWSDSSLVQEGLEIFKELSRSGDHDVLLATDLHAGNVLRSKREPWLVIDPKPFVGDPAYDATQHLFNCPARLRADSHRLIHRMADLLDVDRERARLWMFARAASEPRNNWLDDDALTLARSLR